MKTSLTSYDNPTVGSGNVVNDVQFAYNDFGQLTTDYQSHSGAVNVSTTPKVQYGYASGATNTIRPTSLTYPNGRVLTFSYGTSGGISDHASRVASLIDNDGTTHLVDYEYLGRGTFVVADDTQPDVKWMLVDLSGSNDPDTGDIYSGLDRFGRVQDNRWYDYGSSTDVDRIQYGYDRVGNRIWRENTVATSLSNAFDELYSYDAIHRLQDMQRGTLNSGHTALTSETFAQCWTLDATGNWSGFRQDDTGDGTWDLVQARTANPVNEITEIANSAGSAWIDPAYSAAGNMTTMPQPAAPTQSYTATYDAWNRLVKLVDGADTVSEYAYDGAKRRVVQQSYSGGSLSETRHLYYTQPSQWQVVEERIGSSNNPQRQFVWGLRYIDDCVLRDRDTGGGTLDERLYACQDANWNVDALVDTAGDAQERYAYSAYGVPTFLTPGFGARSTSSNAWESLYCGYRFERATGVYHVRHRIFLMPLGVWGQRDPLGYVNGPQLYAAYFVPQGTDPYGLSFGSELAWCLIHPCCCSAAINSGPDVKNEMWNRYGPWDDNTVENAVQHCAWMCYVASLDGCDEYEARSLGDAHESGASNPWRDKKMDLFNNYVGSQLGRKGQSLADCFDLCEAKAKAHELEWYAPVSDPKGPGNGLPNDFPPKGRPGSPVGHTGGSRDPNRGSGSGGSTSGSNSSGASSNIPSPNI